MKKWGQVPERIAMNLAGIMRVVEKHGVPIQFPTAWSQFPGGLFYGDPLRYFS